ncbi:hypothetical protein KR074_000337 [Drosophila pseudoananassae]|nr:hypothetical protein KR074_000337 [Drosophila pseudoananassae]
MAEGRFLKNTTVFCARFSETSKGLLKDIEDSEITCFEIPSSGKHKEMKIHCYTRKPEESDFKCVLEITDPDCHLEITIDRRLSNLWGIGDNKKMTTTGQPLRQPSRWKILKDKAATCLDYCVVYLIFFLTFPDVTY